MYNNLSTIASVCVYLGFLFLSQRTTLIRGEKHQLPPSSPRNPPTHQITNYIRLSILSPILIPSPTHYRHPLPQHPHQGIFPPECEFSDMRRDFCDRILKLDDDSRDEARLLLFLSDIDVVMASFIPLLRRVSQWWP